MIFMKNLTKSIEMIAWFTEDGLPTPIRFKVEQPDGTYTVVHVARTMSCKMERIVGNPVIFF